MSEQDLIERQQNLIRTFQQHVASYVNALGRAEQKYRQSEAQAEEERKLAEQQAQSALDGIKANIDSDLRENTSQVRSVENWSDPKDWQRWQQTIRRKIYSDIPDEKPEELRNQMKLHQAERQALYSTLDAIVKKRKQSGSNSNSDNDSDTPPLKQDSYVVGVLLSFLAPVLMALFGSVVLIGVGLILVIPTFLISAFSEVSQTEMISMVSTPIAVIALVGASFGWSLGWSASESELRALLPKAWPGSYIGSYIRQIISLLTAFITGIVSFSYAMSELLRLTETTHGDISDMLFKYLSDMVSNVVPIGVVILAVLSFISASKFNRWLLKQGRDFCQAAAKVEFYGKQAKDTVDRAYERKKNEAWVRYQQDCDQAQHEYQQEKDVIKARFESNTRQIREDIHRFTHEVNAIIPAWADPEWDKWQPAQKSVPALRLGELHVHVEQEHAQMPAVVTFPGHPLLFKADGSVQTDIVQAIQAALLRLMATIPPGRVKFTFIDPVGLGQNVASFMPLADYDDSLVGSKVWTEERHIKQRLANLTEHMETVIQKYLQNKYATIEEYNAQAGEIAEPYQVLVVLDFPVNFSEEAARRLVSIAQNGSRCGVFTIVLVDLDKPRLYGFKLEELERTATVVMRNQQDDSFIIDDEDYRNTVLEPETLPPSDLFNHILNTVGQASTEASKVEVPFDRLVPASDQWWSKNASSSLVVPIGPTGARKHQEFEVGKGTAHHALVVGKTGSGKSSLLHTLITSIAMNYSPEEVELYLIDFKKGVEFKIYATHRLPHARVIAIESEREFGLSVLEGLYQKYEERGDDFRNAAVTHLDAYREATGLPMTRILLLVDEFHKFFIEQDKIATRAYQLLEILVREGRNTGIHILLASQTLTGSASLPNSIKEQIGIRIALQCSEADSRLILSDDNPAARRLSRPGEAIYNEANGLVEGNNTFQVAYLDDEPKERYLQEIQNRAQADQTTQIIFEGNQPADIEKNNELQTALTAPAPTKSPRSLKAWVGEPTAIREPTAVTFQRESGNNLLMVGTDEQAAMGTLVTSIISLAAQLPHTPARGAQTFSVLDFSTTDTDEDNPFQYLAEKLPHPIAVGHRRQLSGMINVVAKEVQRRLQDDDTSAPPIFLIIYGLQRARALRLDAPGTGYGASTFAPEEESPAQEAQKLGMSNSFDSQFGSAGSTPSPAAASNPSQQLPMILREGPDFGVYTMVWCDTMTNLNRTFERSALREFILRVAFQMSENDSHNFVESSAANKLGDHRALLYNDEKGTGEKFRPYAVPRQEWMEDVIKKLTG